ncbi:hypothetical protein JOQ06_024878 [Pogonophryne albipinna]|uniref:Coiled-coil domain-containing protein 127 n=1 Tax=Pogonophryne albipinna TaxID=1090488 RepID=A0AAD6AT94_9TELE|nr:hypothetical protein JOQ06_024878 [Pogonophryne albipinna]
MNNLNDPPMWNIEPDPRGRGAGAGDGHQWNYALLVPMLGLAAFRWIWTRESQREIQEVKAQYKIDISSIKSEMEIKYRETLTDRRRAAATLELELEKERQRVKGYKQAMVSQSHQLMEERKQLYEEREALEEEKQRLVKSGAAGARDTHCADLLNMDKRKNGSLMWVYLKYWQLQVTVQKHKRAEGAILGGKILSHTK